MKDFEGQGGSFIADQAGNLIRVLPGWGDALPDFTSHPDMLVALAEGAADQLVDALPALGPQALARLQELETNGKARTTVLNAILKAQGEK